MQINKIKNDTRVSQEFLNQIRIATPCTADWAQMTGDERAKFCGQCQKNVYNLSAMTAREARDLVLEKEGKLCVTFYKRLDGTVLTADCPVGLKEKARRLWLKTSTIVASFLAMLYFLGCKQKNEIKNPEKCPLPSHTPFDMNTYQKGGALVPPELLIGQPMMKSSEDPKREK